jgi:drug/metabolite transporter (DMT)-like permease
LLGRYTAVAFVALVLFWGSAFGAVKVGLEHAPPLLFAGFRGVLGGLAVGSIAIFLGGPPRLRRDWSVFATLALLNVVLFIGLQSFALVRLPSGTTAVLTYLQPIFVGFLAWLLLGERLNAVKVAGLLLGFTGIVVVSAGGIAGDVSVVGVVLGTLSALSWALGTVYFKRVEHRVSTYWAIAVQFVVGGTVLGIAGLATESISDVEVVPALVGSLLYSSLIGTGFAWVIWFALVRSGEASRVAAYIFVVPVVSVILGAIFLDEALSASLALGAALVVCGIYLVNRTPRGLKAGWDAGRGE